MRSIMSNGCQNNEPVYEAFFFHHLSKKHLSSTVILTGLFELPGHYSVELDLIASRQWVRLRQIHS